MRELLCVCGCARESVFDCKCGSAAQLRKQVMDYIGQVDDKGQRVFNMKTDAGREAAYAAVLEYFVKTYGGEQVLSTPRTRMSWILPSVAVVGGLGLLLVAGRRWIGRGAAIAPTAAGGAATAGVAAAATSAAQPGPASEDDAYTEKLDDELADTD
jgi:cytochrome c-type biogenesis protein CcmH/NrfF